MADPTKPLDRLKPFRRINNDSFKPKDKPDGDGAACGCQVNIHEFDDSKQFDDFLNDALKREFPLLSTVLDVVDKILNPNKIADLLLEGIPEPFKTALGAPLQAIALFLKGLEGPVPAIVAKVKDIIEQAIKDFMLVLARRILPRAIRVLPQWVPVKASASNKSVTVDQEIEVEGTCTRSFGNPVDVPFFNWHFWFNWNIEVKPEPGYENVMGDTADPPNTDGATGTETAITKPGTFEIQWDSGALFRDEDRKAYDTGFKETEMPAHDHPFVSGGDDVFGTLWPIAGMFVWASGRHVYDCSRVTDAKSSSPKMCTMINPARAIATARWTGLVFADNDNVATPGIEFTFIAAKRGGYLDHDQLNDTDYEFIIDLPPIDELISPFAIAHTDEVPHNTIVLRPRLLKDLRFLQQIGSADGNDNPALQPVIEPVRGTDPGKPPQQIKLTVPKGVFGTASAYGFILGLAWHDPSHIRSRKLKKCTLVLNNLRMRLTERDAPAKKLRAIFHHEIDDENGPLRKVINDQLNKICVTIPVINQRVCPFANPAFKPLSDFVKKQISAALTFFIDKLVGLLPSEAEEEWLVRVCVNGEWMSRFFEPKSKEKHVFGVPGIQFQLLLSEGDPLFFAMHGTEFDPVGDIMHSPSDGRTMKLPFPTIGQSKRVPWEKIVKSDSTEDRRTLVFQYALRAMFDTTEGVTKLSLGFDNSPLGLIDPDLSDAGFTVRNNPMNVRDDLDLEGQLVKTAHFARALEEDQMILVEDSSQDDYEINYSLEVKNMIS